MIADRLDMTEECVRLHSHLTQFREALSADDAIGRRLNFISQEMNREVNTIGSKANDAEIARRVVVMKEELEKIREQDRKSTRLNSSHVASSYAVFCLKKK